MSFSLSRYFASLIDRACELPVVGILVRAGLRSRQDLAKDRAASIAYFSFVSLFPLILGLVAIGGFFLKSADVKARLNSLIIELFPVSADFVARNIESLVRLRGAAGLVSVIVLLWSASKMVGALSRGINGALGLKRPYALYLSPLRNFGLTVSVSVLVLSGIALTPMIEILAELQLGDVGSRLNTLLAVVAGRTGGFAITAIMIAVVYLLIPYERPRWEDLWRGILAATFLIEFGKELFAAYVSSVASYDAVYGSVSSIIVLLIWLYFSARVILYGTAVIAVCRELRVEPAVTRRNKQTPETPA